MISKHVCSMSERSISLAAAAAAAGHAAVTPVE